MVQSRDTGSILKENYQPTTYKGEAPTPLPKVSEELPWEKLSKKEEELQGKVEEKVKQAEEKKEELEEKGGAVSSIVGAASDLLHKVTNIPYTVGHSLHQLTIDAIEKLEDVQKFRLKERFPLDNDESLMYEYTCYIFSGDTPCSGYLYVTTHHIGFFSDCGDYTMKFWLPLEKIVSIQPGCTLTKKDGKNVFIQRVESDEVNTDAILIYTDENEVHKFYKFGAAHDPISTYYEHAWNVLDHAWRDSTQELKEGKHAARKDPWAKALKESDKKSDEKDLSKDYSKESSKDYSKDSSKDFSKDFSTISLDDFPSKDSSKDFSSSSMSKGSSSGMTSGSYGTTDIEYGSSGTGSGPLSTITGVGYGSSGIGSGSSSATTSTGYGSYGTSTGSGTGVWSEIGSNTSGGQGSGTYSDTTGASRGRYSVLGSEYSAIPVDSRSDLGSGWSSLAGATTHPDSAIGSSSYGTESNSTISGSKY